MTRGRHRGLTHYLAPLALLFFTIIVGGRTLFGDPLGGHDAIPHTLWAQQFIKSLQSGILYPSWAPDLNLGCGSPVFIIYPPLIFYTYSFINLFVEEITRVMQISAFLGFYFSGITFYWLAHEVFIISAEGPAAGRPGRLAALASSFLYVAWPYHIVDLHVRTAMAEFWAFVWPPLIVLALIRIFRIGGEHCEGCQRRWSAVLAAGNAMLFLTHLLSAILYTPVFLLLLGMLYYRWRSVRSLLYTLFGLVMGFGISAVYVLPALNSINQVNIASELVGHFDIANNVLFSELATAAAFNRSLSYMAVATSIVFLLYPLYSILRRRHGVKKTDGLCLLFSLTGLGVFFFMTKWSIPVWELFDTLQYLQFPWRFLAVAALLGSVITGRLLQDALSLDDRELRAAASLILIISLAPTGYHSVRSWFDYNGFDVDRREFALTADMDFDEIEQEMLKLHAAAQGLLDAPTYRPIWAVDHDVRYINRYADWYRTARNMHELGLDAVTLESGQPVEVKRHGPERLTILKPETEKAEPVLLRTFYHPWWKIEKPEGGFLDTRPSRGTGLIMIEGSEFEKGGSGELELRFTRGADRLLGGAVSTAAAVLVCLFLFMPYRPERS